MAVGLTLNQLMNKILFLLRETTFNQNPMVAPPIAGNADYNIPIMTADLNYMEQAFMADTNLAPRLTEKMVTLPITAGLDYTLPTDCFSLMRVEYRGQGFAAPQIVRSKSFDDFDQITGGGFDLPDTGFPTIHRAPFGQPPSMVIRLWPQPTFANAGIASGQFTLSGVTSPGDTASVLLVNGGSNVTPSVTASSTDTIYTQAANLVTAINSSMAVTGGSAWLQNATLNGATITLAALNSGPNGNSLQFTPSSTGTTVVTPKTLQALVGGGLADQITLYYKSLGGTLVNGGDTPTIPAQFHLALAYGVLADYWLRKQDPEGCSDRYLARYARLVEKAKCYVSDADTSSLPSLADEEQVEAGDILFTFPG